jgi:hypothetical protein
MKTKYGWVEIDNVRYDHDIIIHADRSVTKRSKKKSKKLKGSYGHTPLSEFELGFLETESPAVVYIGTGQYGDLPITEEAQEILKGYPTIIRPTPELVELLEEESRPFAAIIHVTC